MCVCLPACVHTQLEDEGLPCVLPSDNHHPAQPSLARKELEGRGPAFSDHPLGTKISHLILLHPVPIGQMEARELRSPP